MIKYSKSTNAFYDTDINEDIPVDAVVISQEKHRELMLGQIDGMVITSDANGNPILVEPAPPSPEEIQRQTNFKARAYLAETDWYVVRFSETGEPIPEDIKQLRAEARASVVE